MRFLLITLTLTLLLSAPHSASAQFCTASGGRPGIRTGLGCLPYADNATTYSSGGKPAISAIYGWAIGIAGAAALLLIAFASFTIATAGGDVKRVKTGQEILSAAVAGVILIVLAIALLNLIGIRVLNLPGFNV